jgi:hypothetical protein
VQGKGKSKKERKKSDVDKQKPTEPGRLKREGASKARKGEMGNRLAFTHEGELQEFVLKIKN